MRAVFDTSALNYLVLIDEVDILPKLFDRVVVPEAVARELGDPGAPASVQRWIASPPDWIASAATQVDEDLVRFCLGTGESEVLSFALSHVDHTAVLDEWAARRAARELGVSVVGTLGLLVQADRRGYLDLSRAFSKLSETSFRVRPSLLDEILRAEAQRREVPETEPSDGM